MDEIPIELKAAVAVAYDSLDPTVRNGVALRLMLYGRDFANHPSRAAINHLLESNGQMHEATAAAFLQVHDRALQSGAAHA